MSAENGAKDGTITNLPLFETKPVRITAGVTYKAFAGTIFLGILLILLFRLTNIPPAGQPGRLAWICMLVSELLFSLYWIITQSVRWNVVQRIPFKDRLSLRCEEKLPDVDVFVCTADPIIEPPTLVINTVLSVMSYNYPTEKLSIYLSDDGGSEFTFYALLEAAEFAKYWLPFCKRFKVELRAPAAYFERNLDFRNESPAFAREWSKVKKLYEDMNIRIETALKNGGISPEVKEKHKGFSEWSSKTTKNDHQSIVQVLIGGNNSKYVDIDGNKLPRLVYLSREKRPQKPHNFKAGSMNALIRVSSQISNAPIILNLDCDMYSNDPDAIRDALCFFLDEKQGYKTSYVQHPQRYHNLNKADTYSSKAGVTHKIELAGIDGYGGTLYCGTGCFHRRASLCGMKFSQENKAELSSAKDEIQGTVEELEEKSKLLANCSYEDGTDWGKKMGLVYGCPVEDIVTGLTIQCRGWRPIYYDPPKPGFLGIAATTLDQALVQHKRWCEGLFQIFLSKYCPFIYGYGKIKLGAQMGYCVYLWWAPISLATVCYATVPTLCLIHGIQIFPQVSSPWFIPFAYVFIAKYGYSLFESLVCGDTFERWWNAQRIWLFRRISSYFFAFTDTIIRQLGLAQMTFTITAKVVNDEVMKRYENGILEFGSSSVMFVIITTLALLNLFGLLWGIKTIFMATTMLEQFIPQIILSGVLVMVNLPVYIALFFRTDEGNLPSSVLWRSVVLASVASLLPVL
ncbi:OLC1v1022463C1 [Oldenlandia corymbosa var. corymbosa]|uniref:OLC1v1022463C1 n=1 Tax=Oldenlandia corymbosa var. corymbosa TaxID=529605 RepID=A0AAV1C0Q1_OLDCO|nr:OLC1v1022463C1 [Oldenlandia corymbosa var. corymbosa]